jgi:non-specific serine/threonine protein kinase
MALPGSDRDWTRRASLRPIIGREAALRDIVDLLRADDARLVVLTGPAGVGKSFLALHCARLLEGEFEAGSRMIPLDTVSDPERVMAAIAYRLGVTDGNNRPIEEELAQALRAEELLLVVDTFEHVLPAAADLERLLEQCPRVRALVTSRSRLGVSPEHVVPVEPLIVPAAPTAADTPETALDVAAASAVQLFVRAAQGVRPDFVLTDSNAGAIAQICRLLDGLPLAIELAASWVKFLTPQALAARLTTRLGLLNRGAHDLPPRLRAMRSALQWSYDLLIPEEQRLFRVLAYLPGSWTYEVAEAVAAADTPEAMPGLLTSLIEKSLIQRDAHRPGETRYRMLGIVREYGQEMLAADGEAAEVGARHAAWCLALAIETGPALMGPDQLRCLDRLDAAHEHLARAFDWFHARREATNSLRLAVSLWRFAFARGRIREARRWLEMALEDETAPDALLGEGLFAAGYLAAIQGDLRVAHSYASRGLTLATEQGSRYLEGLALLDLSFVELLHDEIEDADLHVIAALDALASTHGRRDLGIGLIQLGDLRQRRGELREAAGFYLRALAIFRATGEVQAITWALVALGRNAVERGNRPRASVFLRAALTEGGRSADQFRIVESLEGLAAVDAAQEAERAATLIGAADALRAALRFPPAPLDESRRWTTILMARRALGSRFRDAWSAGREMTPAQAIAFAVAPRSESAVVTPPSDTPLHEFATRHGLTHRELDVLRELLRGKSDREIAAALSIGVRTIQTHVAHVFGKLGVRSRHAAVMVLEQAGLLPLQE